MAENFSTPLWPGISLEEDGAPIDSSSNGRPVTQDQSIQTDLAFDCCSSSSVPCCSNCCCTASPCDKHSHD